jgi:hypothetical protein
MTYQTKKERYKRRVDIIISIAFIIGTGVCYSLYASYFEGADFWLILKEFSFRILTIILLMVLIFACLAFGRFMKKKKAKGKTQ